MQRHWESRNGDKVRLTSRRGQIESTARVGTKVSRRILDAIPLPGWKCKLASNAALDKYARIPEYKVCAIQIEKA